MCSPTCGLERPLRLIRLILSLDHRRTSHWLDWQSLATAAAAAATPTLQCTKRNSVCCSAKVQILWGGHKIWKKNPDTFFWNYLVMSKQSGRFFSNFCGFLRISELYMPQPKSTMYYPYHRHSQSKRKRIAFSLCPVSPHFCSVFSFVEEICRETVTDFTEIIIEMAKFLSLLLHVQSTLIWLAIWDDKDFQVEFEVFSASHSHST